MIADLKPYPEYKDSGLPWLGQIPRTWEVKRAKSIFQCIDERSTTGKEELLTVSSARGIVPRKSANVTMFKAESYLGYKLCWPGDLVINSLWAWAGGLGVSSHHGIVSSAYGVYRVRPDALMIPAFVHEVVRSSPFHWELRVRSKGVWTSRLQLTDISFLDAPMHIPPPDDQEAIVRFLDWANGRLEREIRAKRKVITLLNERKRTIIDRAVIRGLNPSVPFKPSGVPWIDDIPQHWEVTKLYRVTDPMRKIMYGIVLPGPHVEVGVYIVKGGNCEDGRLRAEYLSRTTREIESRYARSRLRGSDIVYAIRGSIGSAQIVPDELAGANLTQDAARIAPSPKILAQWLLFAVRSRSFFNKLEAGALGATIRGINIRDLKRADLVVPPIQEQEQIAIFLVERTGQLDSAISRLEREIELLREYRSRLVADVATGKVDVREAAARLPEEAAPDVTLDDNELIEEIEPVDEAAV